MLGPISGLTGRWGKTIKKFLQFSLTNILIECHIPIFSPSPFTIYSDVPDQYSEPRSDLSPDSWLLIVRYLLLDSCFFSLSHPFPFLCFVVNVSTPYLPPYSPVSSLCLLYQFLWLLSFILSFFYPSYSVLHPTPYINSHRLYLVYSLLINVIKSTQSHLVNTCSILTLSNLLSTYYTKVNLRPSASLPTLTP